MEQVAGNLVLLLKLLLSVWHTQHWFLQMIIMIEEFRIMSICILQMLT
jgi:hypothetical protein